MKTFLQGLLKKALSGVGGVAGWLLSLLLDYTWKKTWDIIEEWQREKELKNTDKNLLEKYRAGIAAGASREERRALASRLLNRSSE